MTGGRANFSLKTTTAIVVANMIGTGIFATLGLQVAVLGSVPLILLTWLIGGVIAFTGALCYSTLATIIPGSGGEYRYLSVLYSPSVGFAAGVISVIAGFAAPLALTAMTFGYYLANIVNASPLFIAVGLILTLSVIHGVNSSKGGEFHFWITLAKIVAIIGIAVKLILVENYTTGGKSVQETASSLNGFTISLLYVSFAYSGWNAACYVAEEVKNSTVNIRSSLFIGTGIVTLLYTFLCFALLQSVSIDEIAGSVDVLHHVGARIWGMNGALLTDCLIAGLLVSSASSLIITGPRVLMKMKYASTNARRATAAGYAISVQALLAIALVLSFSFEFILRYTGFTLSLFTAATVVGLFPYCRRSSEANVSRHYKVAAAIFLTATLSIIVITVASDWVQGIIPLIAIVAIALVHMLFRRNKLSRSR